MSAFEDIGVDVHLALTDHHTRWMKAKDSASFDAEQVATEGYIDTLEWALRMLGVNIDSDGTVTEVAPS